MIHWEQIKLRWYAYSSKTLLMNTLNSGSVNPLPNRIPQSNSMHIMPREHTITYPSTFSYFITLSLEYPNLDSSPAVRSLIGLFVFKSNPVAKVHPHRSRNCGTLEVA